MSPLTRSLFALAAAALLHAACAGIPHVPCRNPDDSHCSQLNKGSCGNYTVLAKQLHVDQRDNNIDVVVPTKCPRFGSKQVGTSVIACDEFGNAPKIQWLDGGSRVRVTCSMSDGQTCPRGLDISIQHNCKILGRPIV